MPGNTRAQRQRRFATRSRSGCTTCRRRHIRCDERRPTCLNCSYKGLDCKFPASDDIFRYENFGSKEALSASGGQLSVFRADGMRQVLRQPSTSGVDPFNSLPIKMPLMSQELFSYFTQAREARDTVEQALIQATKNPNSLRNVLLIAGLHYSWKTGGSRNYQSTYLHHKIECMQTVGDFLKKSTTGYDLECIRMIATLCMAEASIGNLQTAQAHLTAMMTMCETNWHHDKLAGRGRTMEDEAVERYITACIHEVMLLMRARMTAVEKSALYHARSDDEGAEFIRTSVSAESRGHSGEVGAVVDRLHALSLMPNYIVGAADGVVGEVDAREAIEGLRVITALLEKHWRLNDCQPDYTAVSRVWALFGGEGSMLKALAETMSPDANPLPQTTSLPKTAMPTSWMALTLTMGFYLHGVMRLWQPLQGPPLRWLLGSLKRDLDQTQPELGMEATDRKCEFWFWKMFCAAVSTEYVHSLAEQSGDMERYITGGKGTLLGLRKWFADRIRLWSAVTGMTDWREAKRTLAAVVWPGDSYQGSGMSRLVWRRALGQSSPPLRALLKPPLRNLPTPPSEASSDG